MTAQDRELSRMRSSFLEVAALQLAPISPATAAFLQSEKTRLHLAQDDLGTKNGKSRFAACQRCGFSLPPSLMPALSRNDIGKQKSKGTDQITLIYVCKTCGAKTQQKIPSHTRSRLGKGKNVADTSVALEATEAPSQTPVPSSTTTAKPAIARKPQAKKAKSLRAQLAASNITRTTTSSSSSGPGLGLMDFLKQV